MRKIIYSLLALTLLLSACGGKKEEDPAESGIMPIDEAEVVPNEEVVVTVNDEDILGNVYNLIYVQTKIQLYNLGQDIEDTERIKDITLNTLVEQELFTQGAKEEGIEVTKEEVEAKYDDLMESNGESITDFLADYNLEHDAFKDQISFTLLLSEYMEEKLDITVSEEELKEIYDELKEQLEDLQEFDDIKDQLENQVINQRQQEKVKELLDELKEKATIETHI